MKDISTVQNSRDVIRGARFSHEFLYYAVLFGLALITSLVLLVFGIVNKQTSLVVYTAIITPIFLALSLVFLRLTLVSHNTIYVEDGTLVIKSFLKTREFKVMEIGKVSAAINNKNNLTSINVTYGKNTFNYEYKNFNKDEIAHLRRATSKY